jgi:hypothetical protein
MYKTYLKDLMTREYWELQLNETTAKLHTQLMNKYYTEE